MFRRIGLRLCSFEGLGLELEGGPWKLLNMKVHRVQLRGVG